MLDRIRFFLQPSCSLGCINRYGWVVLVEKVSRPWRGQSDDFGHGRRVDFSRACQPVQHVAQHVARDCVESWYISTQMRKSHRHKWENLRDVLIAGWACIRFHINLKMSIRWHFWIASASLFEFLSSFVT
jgi:hypothetical protein